MRLRHLLFGLTFILVNCSGEAKDYVEEVLPGANRIEEYLPILSGKNIALVANNASVVNGTNLVDTLMRLEPSIRVKNIFTPEHGFSGKFAAGQIIDGEESSFSSIKIVSLYGNNKKPQREDLRGIDVVVFDLQDVGVRFYTYISTLHYVMQACAENEVPLLVLDRPNPHCNYVDGPVLEPGYKSFVGMHPVPVVYGMTIGEYAKMINGERWLGDSLYCDLTVIPVAHFNRKSKYVFPVSPSPNLPNMRSIYLYPSLCFFEGTVVSIGRGTEAPFQVYGHPKFSQCKYSFTPISISGVSNTPKLEGELCRGYDLRSISMDSLESINQLDISFLESAFNILQMGDAFFTNYFDLLAGSEKLREDIIKGKTEKEIKEGWKPAIEEFKKIREKYLIYESESE